MKVQVHFTTSIYAPPRRVSVRPTVEADDGSRVKQVPVAQYEGIFRKGSWTFWLPKAVAFSCYLVLDDMVTSDVLELGHPDDRSLREAQVNFREPDLSTDRGRLQRRWFPIGTDERPWDVIVVGCGMGGGNLLYQLAEENPALRVLGLEAGPLQLPTHAANLARRAYTHGDQIDTIWGLYDELGVQPFDVKMNGDGPSTWGGKEVFALGGRSLFWGGLAPRMSAIDRQGWPAAVINDLDSTYYHAAEKRMRVGSPQVGAAERRLIDMLRNLPEFAELTPVPAPVAVERESPTSWRIPTGMFSTADLILDARLQVPQGQSATQEGWSPFLHLSEQVTAVEPPVLQGGNWTVFGVDVTDGTETSYETKTVVLAAGAVETPRIVLASGLTGSPLIGTGLTEHDMWWLHFQMPMNSKFYKKGKSTKIIALPTPNRNPSTAWNVQIELNCERNEGRYVPRIQRQPTMAVSAGYVGAQLVFLCRNDLRDSQSVTTTPRTDDPDDAWLAFNLPTANRLPKAVVALDPDLGGPPAGMQDLANLILGKLAAAPMPNSNFDLKRSARGYVAHEVGSMRMGDDPTKPQDCVVGPDLQVVGQPGLYVCDNSVFPNCPAANPSLTLCALALRLADALA